MRGGELKVNQLQSAYDHLKRTLKDVGKVYCRVYPNSSVTKKPLKSKMGGGKGRFSHHSFFVKPGKILFEISGISISLARNALRVAGSKLPVKVHFIDFK